MTKSKRTLIPIIRATLKPHILLKNIKKAPTVKKLQLEPSENARTSNRDSVLAMTNAIRNSKKPPSKSSQSSQKDHPTKVGKCVKNADEIMEECHGFQLSTELVTNRQELSELASGFEATLALIRDSPQNTTLRKQLQDIKTRMDAFDVKLKFLERLFWVDRSALIATRFSGSGHVQLQCPPPVDPATVIAKYVTPVRKSPPQ